MARIAVLGTGIMGGPMAHNLLRAGHEVTVWNRTVQKAEALEEEGARVAPTPVDAVRGAEILLTMLADARAVEATVIESGALDEMPQGGLWIQSSTVGVAATERLAEQAGERGIDVRGRARARHEEAGRGRSAVRAGVGPGGGPRPVRAGLRRDLEGSRLAGRGRPRDAAEARGQQLDPLHDREPLRDLRPGSDARCRSPAASWR